MNMLIIARLVLFSVTFNIKFTALLTSDHTDSQPKTQPPKFKKTLIFQHTLAAYLCIQDPVGPFPLSDTPSPLPFFPFCLLYCNHFAGPETCGCAGSGTRKHEAEKKRSYMGTELRLNIYQKKPSGVAVSVQRGLALCCNSPPPSPSLTLSLSFSPIFFISPRVPEKIFGSNHTLAEPFT